MPEEISDEKIIKRLMMEREYYQNTDVEDAIESVAIALKIKKERIKALASKVYSETENSKKQDEE